MRVETQPLHQRNKGPQLHIGHALSFMPKLDLRGDDSKARARSPQMVLLELVAFLLLAVGP